MTLGAAMMMTGILEHLKWESLKKRRRDSQETEERQSTHIVIQRSEGSNANIFICWPELISDA